MNRVASTIETGKTKLWMLGLAVVNEAKPRASRLPTRGQHEHLASVVKLQASARNAVLNQRTLLHGSNPIYYD